MKNNISIYAWIMLASLIAAIVITFVICLADVGDLLYKILFIADIAAVIIFTICPTMILRSDK